MRAAKAKPAVQLCSRFKVNFVYVISHAACH